MELSKRLHAVAGLVTEGASVADIGTDHGYIPIYLVKQNIASRVIAADINRGPLERARMHIVGYGVKDRITTRLSDGLEQIEPGEADTMIAAGMGGGLIIRILQKGKPVTDRMRALILQPQSEIEKVRIYLNQNGYQIEKEDMVEEYGKYYPVMRAVHGGREDYSAIDYLYGKRLLEMKHPVLRKYLLREKYIKESILAQLAGKEDSPSARQREAEIKEQLAYVMEALKKNDGL